MQIIPLDTVPVRAIDRYDSLGFRIGRLVAGEVSHSVATLAPGGRIGRHPAVRRQLLTPLRGTVQVAGAAQAWATLRPGLAAVWEPAEEHETRTDEDALLLIIETAAELAVPQPPADQVG